MNSDQYHHHDSQTTKAGFSTLVAGAVIGAALTYLFGTKSGQKVKDELVKEGQKLLDKMSEGLEDVRDKIEESDIGEKISSGAKSVKKEVEETAEEIPQHIAQIQKKGRRFFFRRSHSES